MASWARITYAVVAIVLLFGVPARSKPVSPDPNNCVNYDPTEKCCPSFGSKKIVNFRPESQSSPARVRRPAHALELEEVQKYEKATELMKALPENHPWNFIQQSNIHCAYCGGGFRQLNQNVTLEIHNSWLFFPWHRAYLYFYERILGKLINDTSFTLPFWNWDDPSAMTIPPIYQDNNSSLFNPTRYPLAVNFVDLGGCEDANTPSALPRQRQCNLQLMKRQFTSASDSASLFFGSPYRAGDPFAAGGGSIEGAPHSPVHISTGTDMSIISTAARDPIFFAHHVNVDRLWSIWENMNGNNGSNKVFSSRDFLDASFLFWDENMQLVRIFVRDVVDTMNLGYVYEDVALKWMDVKTVVEEEKERDKVVVGVGEGDEENEVKFPLVLSSSQVSFEVKREVGKKGEKLVVSDIELDGRDYVWFKVYVGVVGGGRVEVGCFINMERRGNERIDMVRKLNIGMTQFIEDIGAEGADSVLVTLVPKVGGDKVVIGGVLIV